MEVRLCKVMETGMREIDAGNEALSFLMARVFDPGVECQRSGGFCDHSCCGKIGAILKFVERQFVRQDEAMAEAGYPSRDDHARDHQALLDGLRSMQAAKLCAEDDTAAVRDFITRWTATHVQRCDRAYGSWLQSRQAPRRAAAG